MEYNSSMAHVWRNPVDIPPRSYVCSYCSHRVGPSKGFWTQSQPLVFIYICSFCDQPTYFGINGKQFPGVPLGSPVGNLPTEISTLYDESRHCASVGSFTAAVLTCRKILMHIAVQKGAKAGGSFVSYVEYLADKGYVPPDGKGWLDYIRKKGNEANHEIKLMNQEDAEALISFVEMLLRLVYEFPKKVPLLEEDANPASSSSAGSER
jgi:Domain of unknown function (DUF4145)